MPDWITHLGTTWILCRILHLNREKTSIALIGSLLPDLYKIATIYQILTCTSSTFLSRFCIGFRTPLGILLSAGVVASLFEEKPFKRVFIILFATASLHIFLDSLMYPWGGRGTHLFWPLYDIRVGYGLFWPNNLTPMLLTTSSVLLFEGALKIREKTKKDLK